MFRKESKREMDGDVNRRFLNRVVSIQLMNGCKIAGIVSFIGRNDVVLEKGSITESGIVETGTLLLSKDNIAYILLEEK